MKNDTIVAVATPPGEGGIGIIRISGEKAEEILTNVFTPVNGWKTHPESHQLIYGMLMDNDKTVDECMAVLMRAPRSYTREDVAELHLHGGAFVLHKGVELCRNRGARLAEPGEFTKRAFLNGRIDLSRAEAVMSLIAAKGEQAHRAAIRDLQGGAASFIRKASDELYNIQAGLAACMDYPDEISDEEGMSELAPLIRKLIGELNESIDERSSRLLRDGLHVTLAGKPNTGKSSLFNILVGEDRAIVTDIPGTTRDTIEGEMTLGGVRVLLTDTAGLRSTEDPVERLGVSRSEKAMREADLVLVLLDGTRKPDEEEKSRIRELGENCAIIISKSDLPCCLTKKEAETLFPMISCFVCSAKKPETLRELKEFLKKKTEIADRMTLVQPRQTNAVRKAIHFLQSALDTLEHMTPDLASTDLQAAQEALSELTGDRADERLLDAVFSQFCVGK